jgi:hypothetical protein
VGRLAFTQGTVSVYQDPELGWDKAFVNTPITSENSIWTEPGARAEVRVGGTAIRLDETTQLDIAHLDDDGLDAHVERGTAGIRIRHHDRNERFLISTPHARFRLLADGRYRIDVDPERDESRLTVFTGSAQLESGRGGVAVAPGRTLLVYGGASPSYAFERASSDAFDRWTQARDERWTEGTSTRYVSSNMTGYEELDQYGDWREDADFGALWYPRTVSSGWVPYREGHWSYVHPWGWTWIDEQPWGYAPFHYGRWVNVRDRWAWHPGRRIDRPTWAPALVGWIGGSNWSLGVSSGASRPALGWYPLSPWDRYEPWYHANSGYANRVNVNVVSSDRAPRQWQGRQDWRTWNRDRGSTVVERDAFIERRPVRQAQITVPPEAIRQQPPAQGNNVLPSRNELQRFRDPAAAQAPAASRQPTVSGAPATPQAGAPATAQRGLERGDRMRRDERPNFARPQTAPAPVPAAQAPQGTPGKPGRAPTAADVFNPGGQKALPTLPQQAQQPQGNALGRGQQGQEQQQREAQQREQQQREAQQRERAGKDAQQNQQREAQQRESQQRESQQRTAREAQQNQLQRENQQQQQERAAKEAQQRAAQQQQQERAAKEAQQRAAQQQQQQQERAAKEAQQQQQQQQRAAQQQQQQQERAAREAQQREQQRAAREVQQRAAQEKQQQDRAAREAQQQLQRTQQQAQQAQQQIQRQGRELPQPQTQQPQQQPQRAPRDDKSKDKEKDDKDKSNDERGGRSR